MHILYIWLQAIEKQLAHLPESQRYGILMHDEMSIRSDLVYKKQSDEIIGFVNPAAWKFSEKVSALTK